MERAVAPKKKSDKFKKLRMEAEALLQQGTGAAQAVPSNILELIHEFQVQQEELEIQNEDLLRAQQEITRLQMEYMDLYEFAPCGYITLNPKAIITRINNAGAELLGADKARILGKGLVTWIAPGSQSLYYAALQKAGETGQKQSPGLQLIQGKASTLWVRADITADRGETAVVHRWRIVLTDLSREKEIEAALRQNEETYRAMFEHNQAVKLMIDPETGDIVDANSAAAQFYGYPLEHLRSMRIFEINTLPPEEIRAKLALVRRGERYHYQFRHRLAGGEIRDVEVHSGLFQMKGRPVLFSIIHDITERIQTEKELLLQQRLLSIRNRINHIFLTVPDDEMYAEVLKAFLGGTQSEYGTFGYFDERGAFVAPALSRDIYWEKCNVPDKEIIFQKGTFSGIWQEAIQTRQAVIQNTGPFRTPPGHIPIGNTIVVPVMFRGQVISTIHLANKSGGYDDNDRQLLESIAQDLAPVLYARLAQKRQEAQCRQLEEVQFFLLQCGADGEDFFASLARFLAQCLGMDYVCIDELMPDNLSTRTVAVYYEGRFDDNVTYTLKDTPCGEMVDKTVCCFPRDVCALFPKDEVLRQIRAESYVGATIWGSNNRPIGLIAVIGRRPLLNMETAEAVLKLTAMRAASEMERRQGEKVLQDSEERYRDLFDNAPEGILVADSETRNFLYSNSAITKIFGYSAEEILGLRMDDMHPHESLPFALRAFNSIACGKNKKTTNDIPCMRKDGSFFWADISAVNAVIKRKAVVIGFVSDITARKQMEDALRISLKEKETLLMELYHRTKNNMQVIMALLDLKAGALEDPRTVAAFQEVKTKIKSMAMVHQKLYQSKNLSSLDLGEYMRELAPMVLESHLSGGDRVKLRFDLQSVQISIDSAMPCGLILNELIVNAVKHAFPAQRPGEILVGVRACGTTGEIELKVEDNGVGLPAGMDFHAAESIGFQSVRLLVELQLRGKIEVTSRQGTQFTISFKEQERKRV